MLQFICLGLGDEGSASLDFDDLYSEVRGCPFAVGAEILPIVLNFDVYSIKTRFLNSQPQCHLKQTNKMANLPLTPSKPSHVVAFWISLFIKVKKDVTEHQVPRVFFWRAKR